MSKALFFDIDGTLVSFKTHRIPDSAVAALRCAKNAGHSIFISTGRPRHLIDNLGEIEDIIEGYITTNGAYCFVNGAVINCTPVSREDVETVIGLADEMDFSCMVVGENEIIVYRENEYVKRLLAKLLNVCNFKGSLNAGPMLEQNILQLSPFVSPELDKIINPRLKASVSMRWCPYFADIFSVETDKAKGLDSVIAHLGINIEDTIAFGDGENDIPIIRYAGTGVAMGNSNDCVKAAADLVTSDIDNDGIESALKRLGIIG